MSSAARGTWPSPATFALAAGCPLEGKQPVRVWPSFELADAIRMWFGDALNEAAPAFNPPEQLAGGAWSSFCCHAD